MPQNGFHGLVGLGMAKALARHIPKPGAFVPGVVLGSMLPDADMFPTAIAVLLKHGELTYVIHRSATHSLLFAAFLGLISLLAPKWRWTLLGLALGVLSHILLDIVFWFAPIDLLWPFSQGKLLNVWNGVDISVSLVNVRQAFEAAAFAFLLEALARISGERRLRSWSLAAWVWFAIALPAAFIFRDSEFKENVVVMTPYLLAFLPFTWWQVWRLRVVISEWAIARQETAASIR